MRSKLELKIGIAILELLASAMLAGGAPYDIVAIRSPRGSRIQQVFDPITHSPGQDLVLIHPDGSEEVLHAAGKGACFDPVMSLDGKRVYFAKVHDQTALNGQVRNGGAAISGSDIFVLDLATRQLKQLTKQEITPNTGAYDWSYDQFMNFGFDWRGERGSRTGYGVYNCGPCPVPDGKGGERLVFTSNKNCFLAPKGFSFPNLQLFIMDADGGNCEQIGHLNIGSALHPVLMHTGEVMFASWEMQGLRDQRLWALWSIWPDGRVWEPLYSAFTGEHAAHWQTQLADGRIVVDLYYNLNNWGFGTLLAFKKQADPTQPPFGPAADRPGGLLRMPGYNASVNPSVITNRGLSFAPPAAEILTQFANWDDTASALLDGVRQGKAAQPMAAPGGDLLMVYSPGNVNGLNRPTAEGPRCQIAVLQGGQAVTRASQLKIIKADPAYEYQQPHAVASWKDIYGAEPKFLPVNQNDGKKHALLPAGTPYGLIGTSSVYRRDSAPHTDHEVHGQSSNWGMQGSDAGLYDNSEIDAIRIIQTEPRSYAHYPIGKAPPAWKNQIFERLKILGEIKLRKQDANGQTILDPEGNPDTSFLAKIPADTPFLVDLVDEHGLTLTRAQTWHQLRPGEIRNDCGGCHAHSQVGLDFGQTAAAKPDYQPQTLDKVRTVEFTRDVKPILDANCASCHIANHPSGLDLSGTAEQVYAAVTAPKYIAPPRARQSLLVWKLHGKRLDGFDKKTDPVQNPTLQAPMAGARMPYQMDPLPDQALRTIAEWIDTGCAIGEGTYADDLRPTIDVRLSGARFLVAALDSDSGLAGEPQLSVDAAAVPLVRVGESIWSGDVPAGIHDQFTARVSAVDAAGHRTTLTRALEVGETPPPPPDPDPDPPPPPPPPAKDYKAILTTLLDALEAAIRHARAELE